MNHLKGPFSLEAAMSSDFDNIRHINADIGQGKPYACIASVRYVKELTQDENLAIAKLLALAPELRDSLKECIGFVEAWQSHLADAGNDRAAKTVGQTLERAHACFEKTCSNKPVPKSKSSSKSSGFGLS